MSGRHFAPEPDFQTGSERQVFELLKRQLLDDAVVFCNLRFSDRRVDREADLVIGWPHVGVAVRAPTFGSLASSQMRFCGGEGVPVRFVPCATDEAIGAANFEVDRLLAEGWKHEHVALLTTYRRHPVQVERQRHGQDAYWDSFCADDDVFFGHVLGFKGLERPAVVLAVNGFRDEQRAREMLYVGLSRARDLLVVCGELKLIRRLGGEAVVRRLTGLAVGSSQAGPG